MGNPTTTPITESRHAGGFIVAEAPNHFSRDIGTISGAALLSAGAVLGVLLAGTTASSAAFSGNTGNGAMGTVTPVSTPTEIGAYTLAYTDATHFTVTSPDGHTSTGVNGTQFNALGIKFSATTGGTPMVAGDGFSIAVTDANPNPTTAVTANAGNTGNTTLGSFTTTKAPQAGTYKLTITSAATNAGAFVLEGPDGIEVGTGNVAAAFAGGGLSFTLADGSSDFVAGDGFNIIVVAGSKKYVPFDPSAATGAQNAVAVLYAGVDTTLADKKATIITRHCQVNTGELVWGTYVSAAEQTTALAALAAKGIIAR